jgi:hypothetical protein
MADQVKRERPASGIHALDLRLRLLLLLLLRLRLATFGKLGGIRRDHHDENDEKRPPCQPPDHRNASFAFFQNSRGYRRLAISLIFG